MPDISPYFGMITRQIAKLSTCLETQPQTLGKINSFVNSRGARRAEKVYCHSSKINLEAVY